MGRACEAMTRLRALIWRLSLVLSGAFVPSGVQGLQWAAYEAERHLYGSTFTTASILSGSMSLQGVGRAFENQRWATMISPTHFLSADHLHPLVGNRIVFRDAAGRQIARGVVAGGKTVRAGSDLWLGWLQEPVPPEVTIYALLSPADRGSLEGLPLFTVGFVPGVNHAFGVGLKASLGTTASGTLRLAASDPTGRFGGDHVNLVVGDSGGPTFVCVGGEPVLAGIHWSASADTFVPDFLEELENSVEDGPLSTRSLRAPPPAPGWVIRTSGGLRLRLATSAGQSLLLETLEPGATGWASQDVSHDWEPALETGLPEFSGPILLLRQRVAERRRD